MIEHLGHVLDNKRISLTRSTIHHDRESIAADRFRRIIGPIAATEAEVLLQAVTHRCPENTSAQGRIMPDFTRHPHPALAVACPRCAAEEGAWCRLPDEQGRDTIHHDRQAEADHQFLEQYGPQAAIIHAASGWLIDPRGCARD
jgi:hypothetical protein